MMFGGSRFSYTLAKTTSDWSRIFSRHGLRKLALTGGSFLNHEIQAAHERQLSNFLRVLRVLKTSGFQFK